jgi:hypothetical protein
MYIPVVKVSSNTDQGKARLSRMERGGCERSQNGGTKLAAYAKFQREGCYQFASTIGFCWGMTLLIVHTTRFDYD